MFKLITVVLIVFFFLSLQDDVIKAFLTHCLILNQIELNRQSLLTSDPFLPIISGKLFDCF